MTNHCGQGSQACCSPWGCKESDMTEWLNWTESFVNLSVHRFMHQVSLKQDRPEYYMMTDSKRLFNDVTFITWLWLLPSCCYWHSPSFYGGPATRGWCWTLIILHLEPYMFNPCHSWSRTSRCIRITAGIGSKFQFLGSPPGGWFSRYRVVQESGFWTSSYRWLMAAVSRQPPWQGFPDDSDGKASLLAM